MGNDEPKRKKNKQDELIRKTETALHDQNYQILAGRHLSVRSLSGQQIDTLDIRSASGHLELIIQFTECGPRIIIPDSQVTLQTSNMTINSENLNFNVSGDVKWHIDGEFSVHSDASTFQSTNDVSINGRFVKLNCDSSPSEEKMVNALKSNCSDQNGGES
jgi:hypothetical protein